MGARLILKAYPPPLLARSDPVAAELDLEGVADNEIRTHTRLQVMRASVVQQLHRIPLTVKSPHCTCTVLLFYAHIQTVTVHCQ